VSRGHTRTRHERSRRGKTQCTRTGNHEHGDGVDNRRLDITAVSPPSAKGQQRDEHDHRDKHRTHPVHQALNGCLGRLGTLNQPDDPGQSGFRTDGRCLHQQQAVSIDRTATDTIARLLRNRQAFTGQHGLVQVAAPLHNLAIHCYPLTGFHNNHIAHADRIDGDLPVTVASTNAGDGRPQRLERTDRFGGLPLGPGFKPLAQQNQRDHHG
jgi:hypothetical protein